MITIGLAGGLPVALVSDLVIVGETRTNEVQRVALQIQAHFAENPLAAESLEGIVRWWLLQQRFEEAWKTVSDALDWLVQTGAVRRTKNAGGNTVYSIGERPVDSVQ